MTKKNYDYFILLLLIALFQIIFTLVFTYSILNNISENNATKNFQNFNMMQPKLLEYNTNLTKDDNKEESIPVITIDRSKDDTIKEYIEYRYEITDKEFEEFVRVVEAEVTGDNPKGLSYEDAFEAKLHVAQVILNRVESPYFPDTIHDVIFQKNAFTPILDGRYWEVEISQVTIDACKYALLESTEDTTYGCEFFISGSKECKYGSYVFTDKVNHSFFRYYKNND